MKRRKERMNQNICPKEQDVEDDFHWSQVKSLRDTIMRVAAMKVRLWVGGLGIEAGNGEEL